MLVIFISLSMQVEQVGINWYKVTLLSINFSFKSWITNQRDFLSTCFVDTIYSNVPFEPMNRCIGNFLSYSPNNRISICLTANYASSTNLLIFKFSAYLEEWHNLSICFVFKYIGLAMVKSWFTDNNTSPHQSWRKPHQYKLFGVPISSQSFHKTCYSPWK